MIGPLGKVVNNHSEVMEVRECMSRIAPTISRLKRSGGRIRLAAHRLEQLPATLNDYAQ